MCVSRVAIFCIVLATAAAFVPASICGRQTTRVSGLQMVIGLPYKPVFSYEWGATITPAQKAATEAVKARIASSLPAERVHVAYIDAKANKVAIEVVSETFDGKAEQARTLAVMNLVGSAPFTVDELYTVTFLEKFGMGMEKALPDVIVFDKRNAAQGFDSSKLAAKIKEMTSETAATMSPAVRDAFNKVSA